MVKVKHWLASLPSQFRMLTFVVVALICVSVLGYFVWTVSGVRGGAEGSQHVDWVQLKKVGEGLPVPDFLARDTQGQSVQLSKYKTLRIVNFWTSWCGPCLQEIPSLAVLAQKYSKNLEVIAVSCDSQAVEFHKALHVFPNFSEGNIHVIFDPDKRIMGAYGVTGFPESFIVSQDGKLLRHVVGSVDWSELPAQFPELFQTQ